MSDANNITVMLVDDHAVVRQGYRTLLEETGEISVIFEAESGELACQRFSGVNPDVVIMDLTLPGISGLESIRRIIAKDPDAKVLVFSMHEDTIFVEQALQAGASGYITKSSSADVLIKAVKDISRGNLHLDSELAQRIAIQRTRGRSTPFATLSTREFEVFCMLAEGKSINEVADALSLSYKTIANYSTQVKSKLGVSTTTELTRLALRHKLVTI